MDWFGFLHHYYYISYTRHTTNYSLFIFHTQRDLKAGNHFSPFLCYHLIFWWIEIRNSLIHWWNQYETCSGRFDNSSNMPINSHSKMKKRHAFNSPIYLDSLLVLNRFSFVSVLNLLFDSKLLFTISEGNVHANIIHTTSTQIKMKC